MSSLGNGQCSESGVLGCFYDYLVSSGPSQHGGGASFGSEERLDAWVEVDGQVGGTSEQPPFPQ